MSSAEQSTTSYNLDKFIEQLKDCKPLNQKEVKFLIEKAKEILVG